MYLFAFSAVLLATSVHSLTNNNLPPSCDSDIYCQGELLEDVQLSRIFKDSKTFVDKRMLYSPGEILQKYKRLKEEYGGKVPPKDKLSIFVDENFEDGKELDVWVPADWKEHPAILEKIKDPDLKAWAKALNGVWKTLSRKVDEKVKLSPELYSLIYVPNGFVIPGGRFKELYYWDTFWIVKGLLLCDMVDTARGVIENLLYLVKVFGHIPNGSRVYYIQRTQPPMLTLMLYEYFKHTQDLDFVKRNIQYLDKEMDYWLSTRRVEVEKGGRKYKLFRYYAPSQGARPESFREDLETSNVAASEEERQEIFTSLKSAAESGWDFSTRWFIIDGSNNGNISSIKTPYIIPVDLNALLHKDFKILSLLYKFLHEEEKVRRYESLSKELLQGISEVLWNAEEGIWLDYDLLNGKPRKYFYLSNFAPLWTQSYTQTPNQITNIAMNYISKVNLTKFIGGSPTSMVQSGEQWDFPNAWPPLQAFFIQGLDLIGTPEASQAAFHYAKLYAQSNYKGFHDMGVMFEKYDALTSGRTGGGGEYEAQSGFGWTNGFAFEMLDKWGAALTAVSNEVDELQVLSRLADKYAS